ncbi:mycofactocin biosynthesis glycosyltransferase MftF [Tomitella fengzijianii]|uniref:Mycofactocin system glycosyltransferase n=1 Tax=Tomitella fengzijianii TaxID=2597660 RepID=A0A516X388_9ACTN|nr:mycofactocin biosynthesis glycosyltransferase MftF [Tomitella fengzijianii]QDQ97530.1 mycofactocin system glycosyltransferase [Tomitella fengzijianii]
MSRASDNIHPMPPFPPPPTPEARSGRFTAANRIAWTSGVKLRAGRVAIGGSPWALTVLPDDVRPFARALHQAGRGGRTAQTQAEQDAALYLLDRGIADPLPAPADGVERADDVEIVIPVHGGVAEFERCLASVATEGVPVTVVDDATPEPDASRIKQLAADHGARLIVHEVNGGPGAARNTGFAATTAPFVAFIDSDVVAEPHWVSRLRPVFDDPAVGAVGPRVLPDVCGTSAIELYEETRSELDMGPHPSRVVYGVPVGWLPTASAIVRRSAVTDPPFEPGMRIGEDVDLFWRMDEAGWTVRYVTDFVNRHRVRNSLAEFSGRRAGYGSSAALLEARHPDRLIPARPSVSGLAIIAALASRRPAARWSALGVAGYELARQRRLLDPQVPFPVVAEMTALTLWTDAFWAGHLLRRDWWPVGAAVLAATPRSRLARTVAVAMMAEPVRDHLFHPTRLDPVRSLALRALDDASYGTGVITNAIRQRVPNVVAPRVTLPAWPRLRK